MAYRSTVDHDKVERLVTELKQGQVLTIHGLVEAFGADLVDLLMVEMRPSDRLEAALHRLADAIEKADDRG